MERYYINENKCSKGRNEVHKESCHCLKKAENFTDLGAYIDGEEAVKNAQKYGYIDADGCLHCCPETHTGK